MSANKPSGRSLLLTSVHQPFGEQHGDGFGVSYEGSHQIMWAQGIFQHRATTTQWGIEFIAANLSIPTTTLHYPTLDQFAKEVQKGYDYIGIAFVPATKHKMVTLSGLIRQLSPSTQIILGGYGTAMGSEIEAYGDHICKGEGVAFMRELLGEDMTKPIVQPVITQTASLFGVPLGGRTGYIIAGLGCPNGCDFCATSHYFKRRHICFLEDGRAILKAMYDLRKGYPEMSDFWINDEDFFLNPERGRGFLEAVRGSSLPALSVSVFSSVKALSQYKASELVEMGIDQIWIGFEGKRAGYSKMQGTSYRELFKDLKEHGISILASMIIGFDYQTPAIIRQEFEELMSLRPTMCQFLIYGPSWGTPFFDRMLAENRLDMKAVKDSKQLDGFNLVFEHPIIDRETMQSIQRLLYREEFQRLGPSLFRIAEDRLNGFLNLKNHPHQRVRDKALRYASDAHGFLMLTKASKRYLNRETASWLDLLEERIREATGPMSTKERMVSLAVPLLLQYTDFTMKHGIGQQPKFTQHSYRSAPRSPYALAPRSQAERLKRLSHNAAGLFASLNKYSLFAK